MRTHCPEPMKERGVHFKVQQHTDAACVDSCHYRCRACAAREMFAFYIYCYGTF
jgi:hypothetical protein